MSETFAVDDHQLLLGSTRYFCEGVPGLPEKFCWGVPGVPKKFCLGVPGVPEKFCLGVPGVPEKFSWGVPEALLRILLWITKRLWKETMLLPGKEQQIIIETLIN